MTNDVILVVEMCRRSFMLAGLETNSASEYLAKYSNELTNAGRVFQFLRLARPDSKSPLGWRPTERFMTLIAARLIQPEKLKTVKGRTFLLDLLQRAVFGEPDKDDLTHGVRGHLALDVLQEIGLVHHVDDEDQFTGHLLDLFGNGHFSRLAEQNGQKVCRD
jgi:hypothetical protein